jgi:hypothetical protein
VQYDVEVYLHLTLPCIHLCLEFAVLDRGPTPGVVGSCCSTRVSDSRNQQCWCHGIGADIYSICEEGVPLPLCDRDVEDGAPDMAHRFCVFLVDTMLRLRIARMGFPSCLSLVGCYQ